MGIVWEKYIFSFKGICYYSLFLFLYEFWNVLILSVTIIAYVVYWMLYPKAFHFIYFFLILKIHLGIACFSIFKCHLNLAIVMYPFINWKILVWVGLVKRMLQRWSPKLWDLKGNRILSFAHPSPFSSHATTWNSTIDIALLWTTVHVCTNSVV